MSDTITAMNNSHDMINFKAGFIAVMGKPNVGKSTLINALLGQKVAAVSPRPQTTRKRQMGILTLDSAQLVFIDTPGVHIAKHKLGKNMNIEAADTLQESDMVLFLADASQAPTSEDLLISDLLNNQKTRLPVILALNKIDLLGTSKLANRLEDYSLLLSEPIAVMISALSNINLDKLLNTIIDHLPEGYPFFPEGQVTDLFERELAADLIREASLNLLRDEVPHGIAIRIDQYTEREGHGAYIEATLFVERESHKGIVIGKGGRMLKQIGSSARYEIENMSGRKVFLRLRVKVRKNWRNDEKVLRWFGY